LTGEGRSLAKPSTRRFPGIEQRSPLWPNESTRNEAPHVLKLFVEKSVDYVAAVLLAAMTVLVFLQVLFRYWLQLPLDWGEEVSRYLFIWSAMLGAAIGTKRRAHFGIDFAVKALPLPVQTAIAVSVNLCICGLMGLVAVQGTKLALSNLSQISPTLAIPMAVPYAAIPACALLMLAYTAMDTWGMASGAGRRGEG
jgi:TRAP-type C4-dicarboxylate transport system permease small subunit